MTYLSDGRFQVGSSVFGAVATFSFNVAVKVAFDLILVFCLSKVNENKSKSLLYAPSELPDFIKSDRKFFKSVKNKPV